MTTTANIAAKGCKGTGVTERHADSLFHNPGKTFVAVVEFQADGGGFNLKGDNIAKINILTIEPAPDRQTENHLRNLAAQFFYERRLAEDGPTFDDLNNDGPAPKVADILAAGEKHLPHPYLSSGLSTDDNAICDVCGLLEDAPQHVAYAATNGTLDDDGDDDATEDESGADTAELDLDEDPDLGIDDAEADEEPANPDDPAYDPHTFQGAGPEYACIVCDQAHDAAIHTNAQVDSVTT